MSSYTGSALIMMLSLSCLGWSYSAARKNEQGNEFYKKGDYEQALNKYSEAMTEAPEKPELYFNVGDALYKQSRFPESLKLYEKAAAPGDMKLQSKVFYNIGNAKYRSGEAGSDINALREAAACYVKALEIAPDDRDAKYNLELALREIRKIEKQKKEEEKKQEEKKKEEDQKKEQERKEQGKKEQEKKEQEQKEQGKKEQEKKEQERKEQGKKEQEKKEQERKEQGKKEQEKQDKQKGGQQSRREAAQAGEEESKELTERQAEELIQSFEREQRDPTHFIETQIAPVPKEVEKDW